MRSPTKTERRLWLTALLLAITLAAAAALPDRPNPPRLVNDLAGVLGNTQALEDTLEAFAMRTSNQIAVVTVNDLEGYEPSMYAYEIGQRWGVGGKKMNNGVVILIKPKTDTKGQVAIATGYGLEGALPDAICRRIIEQEMIPAFRQNDYAGGVWATVSRIMPIAAGEISEREAEPADAFNTIVSIALIIFIIVIILALINDGGGNGHNTGTWGGPTIFFGPGWGSGGSSWGRGGGSFGGGFGGGGWGGFGGGSFGGGGASGSW